MNSANLKLMHSLAVKSETTLGGIVKAALPPGKLAMLLAVNEMAGLPQSVPMPPIERYDFAAAIESGLSAAGYRIERDASKPGRHSVNVISQDGDLVASGSSNAPGCALEHAMLGAMREGK